MKTSNRTRGCLLLGGAALIATTPVLAQQAQPLELEEIIVTATKRKENVRDIPAAVSAISGQQLDAVGAQSFADYIQRSPGVVFNSFQPGTSHVVIRGVATNSGNVQGQGTTGYYINEVPLTEPGWTIVIPDVDAFDVSRVEILRGPQGSLFGSASMGGAVNYVANVADAGDFAARVETTVGKTRGADVGYSAKAMLNVPLVEEKFAVRGVFGYREQPGYLDNVGIGKKDSSDISVTGGRLSAVWTASASAELSWLSLYQRTDADDAPYRNPAIGELGRSTAIAEPNESDVQVHSLRLDQDLGFATLTALGAYQKKTQDFIFDFTPYRVFYNADLQLDLTSPLYIGSGGESEGQSIELRLASNEGGVFEWLVGAMYFKSDKDLYERIGAAGAAAAFDASPLFGPGSGAVIAPSGEIFNAFYTKVKGEERALFGEASWNLADGWKLTAGGRLYQNEIDSTSRQVGFSTYPGDPIVTPTGDDEDGFSPKVSLSYRANDDLMMYALYSEGFRFGTPNTQGLSDFTVPGGSKSDSLKNYEIGARTNWLGNALLVDATVFYVDWQDIQLRLQTPDFFNYAANGGAAEIKGIETSITVRPAASFDWQSSVTYMEARLTEPLFILFAGSAPKGSRLPGSSDWSVSNTASYQFAGRFEPTLVVSHRYLSKGISDLNSAVPGAVPSEQGDYNLIDVRLRATFGSTMAAVFADNIGDERGITRTVPEANGLSQGLVRPRTYGLTLNWSF